eukprot:6484732-Amphidinium_carterae.2
MQASKHGVLLREVCWVVWFPSSTKATDDRTIALISRRNLMGYGSTLVRWHKTKLKVFCSCCGSPRPGKTP